MVPLAGGPARQTCAAYATREPTRKKERNGRRAHGAGGQMSGRDGRGKSPGATAACDVRAHETSQNVPARPCAAARGVLAFTRVLRLDARTLPCEGTVPDRQTRQILSTIFLGLRNHRK